MVVNPSVVQAGARTAAALIHERGVVATTLEDVKMAAEVSGSQMYHYFPDKNELVQAIIDYQADTIVYSLAKKRKYLFFDITACGCAK